MLKIEKHVIRMAIMLGVVLRVGYAADFEAQFQSELENHRARVVEERKKIETQFANCKLCKGSGVATRKMTCETCGGGGVLMEKKGSFSVGKPCVKCNGKGSHLQSNICSKCCPYEAKAERAKPQPAQTEAKRDKPKCDKCKGKGRIIKEVPCSACHGQGGVRIPAKQLVTGWSKERWSKCGICNASGKKSVWEKCSACNGKGAPQDVAEKKAGKEPVLEGVKPDVLKWLQYSADKGNVNAQYCLGVMCATGDGVPKDMSAAVKWFSKATEQRHIDSEYLKGCCYALGAGVAKDVTVGIAAFRNVADRGCVAAQYNLGLCYDNGIGVSVDKDESLRWYQSAAKGGCVAARNEIDRRKEEEARIARLEESRKLREKEEMARVRREKAEEERRRAEYAKAEAAEKQRRERERAERAEKERQEFVKHEQTVRALPKDVESWRQKTDDKIYMECSYPREESKVGLPPIQVRVYADGSFAFMQTYRDGTGRVICSVNGDAQTNTTYVTYLALYNAANKAREWKKVAMSRNDVGFNKEIPLEESPVCCSGAVSEDGEVLRHALSKGPVQFRFAVVKLGDDIARALRDQSVASWFRNLGKDVSRAYVLVMENGSNYIFIDMDWVENLLRMANPIGAFEAMDKMNTLYK